MKKKIIIGVIVIICFIGLSPFVLSIFDSKAPPRYSSVEEFETELHIKTHEQYDLVNFIESDEKILLRDTQNNISISSKSFKTFDKQQLSYHIYLNDNADYSIGIHEKYYQSFDTMQKFPFQYGTVYQYDYTEKYSENQNTQTVVTIYYQDDFYCQVSYTYFEDEKDLKAIQDKSIEYFNEFEKLNADTLSDT